MSSKFFLNTVISESTQDAWYKKLYIKYSFLLKILFVKPSHKKKMKQAWTILKKINQPDFKNNPAGLFSYIKKIDPFVFEELLLLAFRFRGFRVVHNKRYTGDGGIDGMIILPNCQRMAIQAKRYANHINPAHINTFRQDLLKKRCQHGVFIHCGKSGSVLYDNLSPNITLISGHNLHVLLTRVFVTL